MPRRSDLHRILVIGSGPLRFGQGTEFDYSGTQAAKSLKDEEYGVILVNSNPATVMTDPEIADRTYIAPVTPEFVELIIAREKPDALLPTMGGQTALNVALVLHLRGVLERHGVELIGTSTRAIAIAEDRKRFGEAMRRIGLVCTEGRSAASVDEATTILGFAGFPTVIRPAFTLGGSGGGIAYDRSDVEAIVKRALSDSPISQVFERSFPGWKEFELEVIRDHDDNVVIVCSIESVDAVGIHAGDAITVAPAMTLTDREYQRMRDAAIAVTHESGVDAGECNICFATNPEGNGMVVVGVSPHVSRSSALASKATGFPIAQIGAKLAVGHRLDEIVNPITQTTLACFEPVLDYVAVKCPRLEFEEFHGANRTRSTQMKSVGESMTIGRTFKEALQKGLRAFEINPRAGRTVPFVSKAIGVLLTSYVARVMLGETLEPVGFAAEMIAPYLAVMEAVFPFARFRQFDPILGPELHSTGDVMGIASSFGTAFARADVAAGSGLPRDGTIFITVNDRDRPHVVEIARRFLDIGFTIVAAGDTAQLLRQRGIPTAMPRGVRAPRPDRVDLIRNGPVLILINAPLDRCVQRDAYALPEEAVTHTTTSTAARAARDAILSRKGNSLSAISLQEWQGTLS